MELVIEMDDSVSAKYATIHRKGCRDVRDPESLGEVTTYTGLADAIYEHIGWSEYAPGARTDEDIAALQNTCKPCVKIDA